MNIQVNVNDKIQRSIDQVFDAIVNPDKIINYFASGVSGALMEGEKVIWKFEDVGVELEIKVLSIETNKRISFEWNASGIAAVVNIELEAEVENQTKIQIKESSFEMNESGVQKALQQTQGWTDFICSMKAWLYTGVNLRKGRTN